MNNFLQPPPNVDKEGKPNIEAQHRFFNSLFILTKNEHFNYFMEVVTDNYNHIMQKNNSERDEVDMRQGQGMLMFIDDLFEHANNASNMANTLEDAIRKKKNQGA